MRDASPTAGSTLAHDWYCGSIPENVVYDSSNYIDSSYSFRHFRSRQEGALTLGHGASIYTNTTLDLGLAARVHIGAYAMLNGAKIICDGEITIGDYCLISWNVVLLDNYRAPRDLLQRRAYLDALLQEPGSADAFQQESRPITIGSNVWIGHDAVVLPGVSIGQGSIVGARAVVGHALPDFSIAIGNPARVVRSLNSAGG